MCNSWLHIEFRMTAVKNATADLYSAAYAKEVHPVDLGRNRFLLSRMNRFFVFLEANFDRTGLHRTEYQCSL